MFDEAVQTIVHHVRGAMCVESAPPVLTSKVCASNPGNVRVEVASVVIRTRLRTYERA